MTDEPKQPSAQRGHNVEDSPAIAGSSPRHEKWVKPLTLAGNPKLARERVETNAATVGLVKQKQNDLRRNIVLVVSICIEKCIEKDEREDEREI